MTSRAGDTDGGIRPFLAGNRNRGEAVWVSCHNVNGIRTEYELNNKKIIKRTCLIYVLCFDVCLCRHGFPNA